MQVNLKIDLSHHRDIAMYAEARGWLHHTTRNAWTVEETLANADDDEDGEGSTTTLSFSFQDHLDAMDFCAWRGLQGRGRLA